MNRLRTWQIVTLIGALVLIAGLVFLRFPLKSAPRQEVVAQAARATRAHAGASHRDAGAAHRYSGAAHGHTGAGHAHA